LVRVCRSVAKAAFCRRIATRSTVAQVALRGFDPSEIALTATPHEIMIEANHEHTKRQAKRKPPRYG
jgi:hypothetical protein